MIVRNSDEVYDKKPQRTPKTSLRSDNSET